MANIVGRGQVKDSPLPFRGALVRKRGSINSEAIVLYCGVSQMCIVELCSGISSGATPTDYEMLNRGETVVLAQP